MRTVGAYGHLSLSISGIILSGMGTSANESTFAFKSCIEFIYGIHVEVPLDNRHQPHTLLLW